MIVMDPMNVKKQNTFDLLFNSEEYKKLSKFAGGDSRVVFKEAFYWSETIGVFSSVIVIIECKVNGISDTWYKCIEFVVGMDKPDNWLGEVLAEGGALSCMSKLMMNKWGFNEFGELGGEAVSSEK